MLSGVPRPSGLCGCAAEPTGISGVEGSRKLSEHPLSASPKVTRSESRTASYEPTRVNALDAMRGNRRAITVLGHGRTGAERPVARAGRTAPFAVSLSTPHRMDRTVTNSRSWRS